jgi:hypothetical protein
MQQGQLSNKGFGLFGNGRLGIDMPRKTMVGIILLTALIAFEIFNFDTTRFALRNLLGEVSFLGIGWAGILAIAFCAIDFAGLARLFTPEQGADEPKAVWYLMGAWLLGATMNAIMTWWAVSLTLLSHNLGNEVLSRQQLLDIAPIFVAVLVWLTRILFIGALSVTGEHMFDLTDQRVPATPPAPVKQPQRIRTAVNANRPTSQPSQPATMNRRIRQRPPVPASGMHQRSVVMHAQSNRQQ